MQHPGPARLAACTVSLALAMAVLLSGCFDPRYPAGLPCSERDTCPPGQTCGADRVCASLAGPADASTTDAGDVDAAIDPVDASVTDAGDGDASDIDALMASDATVDARPPDATVDARPPDASVDAALSLCNLVPVMTSPTEPFGIVTRSGVYGASYEAWQAFDNTGAIWVSRETQSPAWIAYEWGGGTTQRVTRFAISFNNGTDLRTRAPRAFTLEGWNGASWIVVAERGNETGWAGAERREYDVTSPGDYLAYRLHITDDNDGAAGIVVISMTRLELIGAGCPDA